MRLSRIKNLLPAPKDAEGLYLVVSPSQLVLDKSQNWKDGRSSVTVEVWRRKGSDEPTQEGMADYSVSVFRNGSSTEDILKRNTPCFSFEAAKTDKSFDIVLKKGSKRVETVTVTVSADGAGISSADVVFCVGDSGSEAPADTAGWKTSMAELGMKSSMADKYVWQAIKVVYTSGSTGYTGKTCLGQVKEFASVTEQYSLGTSGASSGTWQDTTPPTAVKGKYLWTRTKLTYNNGSEGYSPSSAGICIGYFGNDGESIQGRGVSSTTYYYLATTMATGVTRSTDASSWTAAYQQATADKPYVWRYAVIAYTSGSPSYSDCELIFSYSAGGNPNLLEQTNFSSLQALDKWTVRNHIDPVPGGTAYVESYAAITTGTQAHNAYYDRTTKTTSQIQYKEVLQQTLWSTDGLIRKLEPSTWYTLSFWAKGDGVSTFIYPSVFDRSTVCYIDGVQQPAYSLGSDAYIQWSLSSVWKRHTFTFRTVSSISGSDQRLLFRLYPKGSSYTSNSVYLCMPKLEVGMQATSYISNEDATHFGQPRRRRWAVNTEYFQGAVDERYDDAVLVGDRGFYHCIKTHISTFANKPGVGGSWEQYWTSENSAQFDFLATDIFFAEKAFISNLIATLIQTGYSGSPHIEAEGSEFKLYGKGQYPAIYLAVNDDNKAVLRFQDENTGEFLYDLGPDGIMKEFSEVADSYTEMKLYRLSSVRRVSELLDIATSACTSYYRFNEGYKQIGSGSSVTKQYHVSGGSSPSAKNAQFFTSQNYNGSTIADGWYVKPNNGVYMRKQQVTVDAASVYVVYIYQFSGGKLVRSVPVYFSSTDYQYASSSVGCDESGNELNTYTYTYLYSYSQ